MPHTRPPPQVVTLDLRSYGGEVASHSHHYHQLILPLAGRLDLEVAHTHGFVGDGHGALITARERHSFSGHGDNRFVIVDLPECLPAELDGVQQLCERARRQAFFRIDSSLYHVMQFLRLETKNILRREELAQQWTGLMLLALSECFTASNDVCPARLRAAIRYIQNNFAGPVRTRDVAAAAHLSTSRLHALFRDCLGCTPMAYVTDLRLSRGLELLARTERPIADIAVEIGYADQSAFTRSLKKHRGLLPGRYRREMSRRSAA